MKLTKYSHACFVVEKNDQSLVVDPGEFSADLVIPTGVVGIVITHQHADHCDGDLVRSILTQNPSARIYTHEAVAAQLPDFPTHIVSAGENVHVGDFAVEFCGGEHALIHSSIPRIANLGVMIDGTIYFPGDSFTPPPSPVSVLALPVSAPWMKLSEAMDFLAEVKPTHAFPTHDIILSDTGKGLVDTLLGRAAEENGVEYSRLNPGQSIET